MSKIRAEYIWLDGHKPTAKLRSKTKIIDGPVTELNNIPIWSFDGSSTLQAEGSKSDCMLNPVKFIPDPIRKDDNILVLCEVRNPDGNPHVSNKRVYLETLAEKHRKHEPYFGIEQEFTFFRGRSPLGWPDGGYPAYSRSHQD